ncbi:hypothetical protein BC830DRAFT_1173997 [Chytriomyces sp. MP71]|nr:hypothetical protein BC830DRAFT_1173997 [Chytriomyces sp. MP71]
MQSHIALDSAFDPFKGFQTVLVKITRMMQSRVQELCTQAKLGDDVSAKACQLIEALLNVEVHNRLLCKRHTDVAMISSVYATAKLVKLPISFNHLLASYLKHPQASQAIMLGVYTGEGQEKIDVVKYYNTVFVQHANQFLFGGEGLATVPGGIEIFSPLKFRTEPVAPQHTAASVTRQAAINVGQGRTGRSMGSSRQLFSTRTPSSLKTATIGTME